MRQACHSIAEFQVPKPPRRSASAVQTSTKKVSFSDELAVVETEDNHLERTHERKMEEIGNSTTWQQMKQNYTTWGQVKVDKSGDPKKSKSIPDITKVSVTHINIHKPTCTYTHPSYAYLIGSYIFLICIH